MDRCYIVGRDALPSLLRLSEGESLKMTLLFPEGVSANVSMEIDLDGTGASVDLAGAFICKGSENVRMNIVLRHNVPGCSSQQLFKGIVGGNARVTFDGLVYVAPGAGRTSAHQECHNLLLSETATAESRPQLEIYADDVECSHGATTGFLNPDELFYMRSRGIPEDEARALQISAFLAPVLQRIPEECLSLSR